MVNKHKKRCATLVFISEMQFKSTRRYHLFRMATINKSTNPKCLTGLVKRESSSTVHPLWRTVWRFLKKLEIKLPHETAIPRLLLLP